MRIALFFLLFFYNLYASWCVVHSSQKKIHANEDEIFFNTFQKAIIANENGWYIFKSGPYEDKKTALEVLEKTKKFYPTAYIRKCKKLSAKNVLKKIYLK